MALPTNSNHRKLICVLLLLAAMTPMLIGNVRAQTIDKPANKTQVENKTPVESKTSPVVAAVEQKSVKKELKGNVTQEANVAAATLPPENDGHPERVVIIGEKEVTETKGIAQEVVIKAAEQNEENKKEIPPKKTDKTNISPDTTHDSSPSLAGQHFHHEEHDEDDGDNDIPASLKHGFYFFLALSSGAVAFILFKIYRLRLSRAERKYGVQGDRSNQELTPLPISIEDCHSDDEDQTLFEVQRQNIRIL